MSDLCDDPQAIADERGLRLVLPAPNELFIDIDNAADLAHYEAMLVVLGSQGPVGDDGPLVIETNRTTSPGGNTHVYARLSRPLTDTERIAWQACLGSDRHRELLSMLRVLINCPSRQPTVFFEKAEEDPFA